MLRVHILSKELTYIKLKIVLCSLQDIHELMNFSCQLPTLPYQLLHQIVYYMNGIYFVQYILSMSDS